MKWFIKTFLLLLLTVQSFPGYSSAEGWDPKEISPLVQAFKGHSMVLPGRNQPAAGSAGKISPTQKDSLVTQRDWGCYHSNLLQFRVKSCQTDFNRVVQILIFENLRNCRSLSALGGLPYLLCPAPPSKVCFGETISSPVGRTLPATCLSAAISIVPQLGSNSSLEYDRLIELCILQILIFLCGSTTILYNRLNINLN